jgi:hypothetical protein
MQTPHRFRSKRQLCTYSGLGIATHDSAQFRFVSGQLQRSKKPQQIRGLNRHQLTSTGRKIIVAILSALRSTVAQLTPVTAQLTAVAA